jgi:hypothetical protein
LFTELVKGKRKLCHREAIPTRIAKSSGAPYCLLVLGPDRKGQFVIAMVENITAHKDQAELGELQRRLMQP